MHLRIFALTCLTLVSAFSHADDITIFDSGNRQNQLLELFTSEGCSSCPPADRFLSELQQDEKLWKPWIPVAFHVDYWNYLGWNDVFAKPEYGTRQYNYRKAGRANGVYTPGFFINGQEWRGFFKWNRSLPDFTPPPAGRLQGKLANGKVDITFQPLESSVKQPYLLHWALTGSDRSTDVSRGENANQILHHDFVALESGQLAQNTQTPQWFLDIPVNKYKAPLALSLWVTPTDNPYEVLQATGGWIQ